jgi:branched-chain amino acid transport system ATP-binding protein
MLKTQQLQAGYGQVMILNGVDIDIAEGELVSVIGRNGVGKSTLMKSIIGLNRHMGGTIEFDGVEIAKKPAYQRAWMGIGYVPQGHMVFAQLTVEENLMIGENIRKDKKRKADYGKVYEYFPRLAERRRQKAGTMSGGEQAMLSVGRVLTGNPSMILLDEPSEGVQPNIVKQLGEIILRINKDLGITVLIVEQHIGLIQQVSQRCYTMDKGVIVDELSSGQLSDYEQLKGYLSV